MKNFRFGIALVAVLFFLSTFSFSQNNSEQALTLRESLVAESKKYVGVPYLWGGTTTDGMDCSGFIYTTSRNSVGVQLPRTVEAMYGFMRIVPDSKKEKGDVLFFKTVGNTISHAGIYIGNNQFIHSVSDGPNTGVIVSSLNQTTWKKAYAGVGQFLPPTLSSQNSSDFEQDSSGNSSTTTSSTSSSNTGNVLDNTVIDFTGTLLWNLFSTDSFLFNARGGSFQAHMRYAAWETEPGIGIEFRFEPRMNIVQIPLIFSVTVPHGFRVYAGPVFTFGIPSLIGNEKEIQASVFPGILGFSWQTSGLSVGKGELSFVQDVSWTVFNNPNNAALAIGESFVAGLVFSTGLRFSLDGTDL